MYRLAGRYSSEFFMLRNQRKAEIDRITPDAEDPASAYLVALVDASIQLEVAYITLRAAMDRAVVNGDEDE